MDVVPVSFLLHDTYMANPGVLDESISIISGKRSPKVSVVRLFGSSRENASCCVNVHGYFPRLYIDEVAGMDVESLCGLLDLKLGHAECPVVYNITRHERVNFYGYHSSSIFVLSVELFSPSDLPRLAEYASANLYTSNCCPVRIYEVHIPYLLNFLIDYGIQGVTPFYLAASKLTVPAVPTSRCAVEVSVRVDAILVKKYSIDSPPYPVPPPLGGGRLVCSTFQALWEEEFNRLGPGESFPYYPEGLVDGMQRPDCADMSIAVPATQDLAEGLSGLPSFTLTASVAPTVEQKTPPLSGTQIWQAAPAVEQPTVEPQQVNQSEVKPVLPAVNEVASPMLPNGTCLLRYMCRNVPNFASQLTGVSQVAAELPSRAARSALPQNESQFLCGKLCVLEVEIESETVKAVSFICVSDQEVRQVSFVLNNNRRYQEESQIICNSTEDLLKKFSDFFCYFDPTLVVSWDATRETVGPILASSTVSLGRCRMAVDQAPVATRHYSGHRGSHAHLSGRLVLDLWKVLRKDMHLATTDFEGVVEAVLGEVVPKICSPSIRARLTLRLLERTRVIEKCVEMARLLGMDLESTFTRGSQFRVECILIRAARQEGYILPSSSRHQVHSQPGPAGVPLILEPPGAGLVPDPVAVLDFQSLYPSVIVGYNICYSTCLGGGRVGQLGTQPYDPPKPLPPALVLPGNVVFAQRATRVGLLPRICHEILQTRIMVKRAMKSAKSEARLRQLDARQLTLKLLINVVYGYTTASFTGRMPCVEVADAILLTARKSLECVIIQANSLDAEVIYGDTDSLFVKLRGHSVEAAFEWGKRLVDLVARTNPWPMKLVMEKVYSPCCLMKKKRYVGRAFEAPHALPWIDAKGIETIRRDTCPAVAVTIERIVKTVFNGGDNIARTLETATIDEFIKLLRGKIPLQFFIFQNQVRDKEYYKDPQKLPAAARVAADAGIETVRGDRIAYVITQGAVGAKLTEQVHPPQAIIELDERKRMRLNLEYYLTKQMIPALQRIFGPISNPAFAWLATAKSLKGDYEDIAPTVMDIAQKKNCLLCKSVTASSIFRNAHVPLFCAYCTAERQPQCIFAVQNEVAQLEKKCCAIRKICLNCCSGIEDDVEMCRNAFHCSVYFERETAKIKLLRAYKRRTELSLFANHFEAA